MQRHGTCKIVANKSGGGTYTCLFPETISDLYISPVITKTELKSGGFFQKTHGYRIFADLVLIKLDSSFYAKNYPLLNINEQFENFAKIMNQMAEISLPNREIRLYPVFSGLLDDFYMLAIPKMDSIPLNKSGVINNIGQKINLSFQTKGYLKSEDDMYYQPIPGTVFYLPHYLIYKIRDIFQINNLIYSINRNENAIYLNWGHVEGAIKYKIYRNDIYLDEVTAPDHTYKDEDVIVGTEYSYYIITTYEKDGIPMESLPSNIVENIFTYTLILPSDFNVSGEYQKNVLTWKDPEYQNNITLKGINIYRNGEYLITIDEGIEIYEDTSAEEFREYWYYIASDYDDLGESDLSQEKQGIAYGDINPFDPVITFIIPEIIEKLSMIISEEKESENFDLLFLLIAMVE